jgi:hypothetical protein
MAQKRGQIGGPVSHRKVPAEKKRSSMLETSATNTRKSYNSSITDNLTPRPTPLGPLKFIPSTLTDVKR